MKTSSSAFLAGLIFSLGLGVSGMTRPSKVVGFLDFAGPWDPSLALVMIGAIAAHALSYRWIVGRPSPVLAAEFDIPTRRTIDRRLLIGSALFGIGWGLGGYCPGPALVSIGGATSAALVFVPAMIAGMLLADRAAPVKR